MMQPVPMAPYSPDAAAGHGTPASHGHVHMPACFPYNGAAAPSQPATNGYLYGWSPTASNYSPMHPPMQPVHGMHASTQMQNMQQPPQRQMARHSVRDRDDAAADQHADRQANWPYEYSEQDSEDAADEDFVYDGDAASSVQLEDNREGSGDATRQPARARGAESAEIAGVRAENERLRLELERQALEMRRMSMHPPIPPTGTFGGSPFGAHGSPPPSHAPSARAGHFRPPVVLAGETPAPPATTGFHGLSSAIEALAHGNRSPKLP
jgi:hypothetical protein